MDHPLSQHGNAGYRIALGRNAWRMLQALYFGLERSRQRRALARLSDELLRDVGLTRHDIAREIARPFWRR